MTIGPGEIAAFGGLISVASAVGAAIGNYGVMRWRLGRLEGWVADLHETVTNHAERIARQESLCSERHESGRRTHRG